MVTDARPSRLEPSVLRHPGGLALYEMPAAGEPRGTLLMVHGTLDRARSFARLARRLPDYRILAYDRRGYEGSQGVAPLAELEVQIDDLHSVIDLMADGGPIDVFGHSMGGSLAITAAVKDPAGIRSVITYESPLRWLLDEVDWWVPRPTPEAEVAAFFSMMTAPGTWDRMSETERELRLADGPALVADLQMTRKEIPFGVTDLAHLAVPLTMGLGGATNLTRFKETAEIVTASTPLATTVVIDGVLHGAHLRAPDALGAFIRGALQRTNGIGVR